MTTRRTECVGGGRHRILEGQPPLRRYIWSMAQDHTASLSAGSSARGCDLRTSKSTSGCALIIACRRVLWGSSVYVQKKWSASLCPSTGFGIAVSFSVLEIALAATVSDCMPEVTTVETEERMTVRVSPVIYRTGAVWSYLEDMRWFNRT